MPSTPLVERCRPLDQAIGKKVRAARKMRGLSQTELARRLGITFQQIQKYEKGANRVSASALLLIAEALEADYVSFIPRIMTDGQAAPDPFSALGATIGGYDMARIYAGLSADQQRSVLSVAKAMAGASAVRQAAA